MKNAVSVSMLSDAASRKTNVNWILGTACNYSCSYCPDSLHDGKVAWPKISDSIAFSEKVIEHYRVLDRSVTFVFSGGEPTAYKHLRKLLEAINCAGGEARLISNGSPGLDWWTSTASLLKSIVLSFHIEFANRDKFAAVAKLLQDRLKTHINVTMVPERFDECLRNAEILSKTCEQATITLKPLLIDFGSDLYPYTDSQRKVLADSKLGDGGNENPGKAMLKIEYEDGSSERSSGSQIIAAGKNHWPNWSCEAGIESLAVDQFGEVSRAVCCQGGKLGNINETQWTLPTSGIVCEKLVCHCISDINVSKRLGSKE
ncbi:radical SAM protein [Novipirellula sp. SH528]|uniref:radical SAM protein n=1 Tax=Novipirellula sp. SH528 TaxID=3454466 RepID=UPI003FA0F0EF